MNILVIGGSGFIGTRLIERLLKAGYTVRNYDKNQSETYPNLTFIGDVRDKENLSEQAKEIDVIYNLAAEHQDNVQPVSLYYDVNVKGAENVVYAAKKNEIRTIIFTSTVALYGLNKGIPSEDNLIEPFNVEKR
ncbi:MAG: NAD(P)-dependent oxidoreductase [bacterium]|nr:NAD(P)-dependent oxidoreductase [bacterium]